MAKRKQITWTTPPERRVNKPYPPYIADTEKVPDEYLEHVEVGRLWYIACPLTVENLGISYRPPPFPYLMTHAIPRHFYSYYREAKFFDPPTPAVYLGTLRVEESQGGRTLYIPRHVFLIEGNRYLVRFLTHLAPFNE